jgi:hypothetical protein
MEENRHFPEKYLPKSLEALKNSLSLQRNSETNSGA